MEIQKPPMRTRKRGKRGLVQNLAFSLLGCNIIFVIVACITERRRLRNDPLNFSTLNMISEVIRCVILSCDKKNLTLLSLKMEKS